MREYPVVFAPEAAGDLVALYEWIADDASPVIALAYLERVEAFCHRLGLGRVDKRDSRGALIVIQAGICDGDQLGTRPDVG